jgi:hypothetical protein
VNATSRDPLSFKSPTAVSIRTRLRLVFNHIFNNQRVAMGALLSLPLLAIPSVGSVRLPSTSYSCATSEANLVYSS